MALFRKQSVDNCSNRLEGEVLVLPRLSHTVITGLVLLWVAAVLVWLSQSTYTRKETIKGWLSPPAGVARIYGRGDGVVKSVLVSEGEVVARGQALVVIDEDRVLANGSHLGPVLLAEYSRQKTMLAEQRALTRATFRQRSKSIDQRQEAAKRSLAVLERQQKTLAARKRILLKRVARYRELERAGHLAADDSEAGRLRVLELERDEQELQRRLGEARDTIERLGLQYALLEQEAAREEGELNVQLSQVDLQMARSRSQGARVIVSPREGRVLNIQAYAGQRPGRVPLMTVMPLDSALNAELLVPVRAAGFIEAGQELAIRYDAYPFEKFGLYQGVVKDVSAMVNLPGEVVGSPLALTEPVYRVTAELRSQSVEVYGRRVSLKPGMTLSADINLGNRSLLHWFLEPLYSLRGRL